MELKTEVEKIIREFDSQALAAETVDALNAVRIRYLGKSGELTLILKGMRDLQPEERAAAGKIVNAARVRLEDCITESERRLQRLALDARLKTEVIDISIPSKKLPRGAVHPQTLVRNQIIEIFTGMGFTVEDGREVETDYYNFEALNLPPDHPARETQDTFYITENILLRTQTSTTQIRAMEKQQPPIKMINPGRVYRSDEIDATHSPMFHQVEGLVVDKNITMCDLKGVLDAFAKRFFGSDTKTRLRPSHFPFTEPSIEVDATCSQCGGAGCRVCKGTGWLEILGAGMVNIKVLSNCGIDPKIYSGFAFGLGLDRMTNIKYGITDLRVVFENDIRFLKQFR
ncbi:MAG: phenylalanine--tRNA ligase subunit alpha [Clostridiales bacterium]|jgi:phenylalanyl-tRNA synthetase alpha chain|nr:phenylalanine--tRNA ligase subunit alpha [Clostridiales bacterium]